MAACIIALLCDATFGCQTALADCQPNPTGLIGWWAGDGNANSILGTNNGTLQGGATANAVGRIGLAFNFDGTNNYVQIADSAILRPTNLTIEAWVRFSGLDTPGTAEVGRQYLVFKQNSASTDFEGYDLSKVRVTGGDAFEFRVSTASGQSVAATSTTLITTGVWYHVAAVRGSNFLQIHVNGQLQRQTNVAFAQNYGTLPLYFGSSGQTFWDRKFRGMLDEVTLYSRALSTNEIASIYNAGVDGKCKEVIIATPPQNQNAPVGSNVNFSVSATGFGPLRYRWLFNGATISGATNSGLTLANVQTSSAGNYAVAVSNTLNVITSAAAVLTISTPPIITNQPQSQTVIAGGSANFNVGVGGTAPLSYQWRRAGVPLIGQTAPTLALSNVTTNEAGGYDVVVTNLVGAATSAPPAILVVNVPPLITSGPQSQATVVGSNINFSVIAGGTLPLSYQWRKAGSPLAGQTTTTLALLNVTPGDAGSYDVVVTNVAGAVTSSPPAALTVNVPPFITSSPLSQTVVVGTNTSFNVVAGGTLPLSYQWRKGGLPLLGQISATLALQSVTSNDAGSYDVVVANVAGSATSSPPANLTVNVPPFINAPPQSQTVVAGTNVSFVVSAGGTEPLSYAWQKNGSPVSGQTSDSLTLTSVTTNDAGSYTVIIANDVGTVTSSPPATLIVNVPPFITSGPQNLVVIVGSNVSFTVVAGGTAPLRYQWRKTGTPLVGQTGTSLLLPSVTTNDAGSYDVVVTNVAGAVTSTPPATLTVNVPPFLTGSPQSQVVVAGTNVNFSATAGGTGPLSYQWRKGGLALNGQIGTSLALVAVSTNDAGSYDVVVTNVAGAVTSAPPATLTINVPPFITNPPESQTVPENTFVSLTVGAGGTLPLSYQWRKGRSPLGGQTGPTLNFVSASLSDGGSYDVVVANVAGSVTSTPPAILTVTSSASGYPSITNPPQSQTVVQGANATFVVGVSGSMPLRYQWRKQGAALADQTNATFTLFSVVASDAGNYDVVVTNSVGSVTSTPLAVLAVIPPLVFKPAITNQPQSQRVGIGTSASFSVNASGTAPLSYQWRKNNSPIAGQASATLSLLNVTTNNEGNYDVVVTNFAGSVTSMLASLSVKLVVDPELEKAIVCALTNQVGALTSTDLQSLVHFSIRNRGITNLFGLQYAENLTSLDASQNQISDLAPLQGLWQLNSLELDDNRGDLALLSPLSGLTNLSCLVLGQVNANSYAPLSGLTNLTSLVLRKGNVSSLNFLQNLRRLSSLSLPQNNIRSLFSLSGLTNLSNLDLRWNPTITNYNALQAGLSNLISLHLGGNAVTNPPLFQNLGRLKLLDLAENQIINLPSLTGLTNLNYLVLSRNPLADYSGLAGLSNLTYLELSGNAISNATFLSNLKKLAFADLSYNRLADLAPLLDLTNLQGLVLAGNRPDSFAPVASMSNLSGLWVQNCSITNAAFVSSLTGLRHLNLDENFISDVSPVLGLTNLTGLGLGRNPASNVLAVSGLANLTGLRLEGNSLTDVRALTNLFRLAYLSLNGNQLTNVAPLGTLTNLQNQYLRQNRLRDISYLQLLPRSISLGLELNLLSPTNGTPELSVIEGLRCQPIAVPACACALPTNAPPSRGVDVSYLVQHGVPRISAPEKWFISWNSASSAGFSVSYDVNQADPLPVTASSSNSGLIESTNLSFNTANYSRSLIAVPNPGQTGQVSITLTVVNEGGLAASTNIQVTVLQPIEVADMLPAGVSLDPALEMAFRQASGNYDSELTSVDLLNIMRLTAPSANYAGFSGWQWLTNLTALILDGSSGNLEFLTNLPQLTLLQLNNPAATDLIKLSALTNLTELALTGLTISNLSFITPMTTLRSLSVGRTRVSDLTPLSTLTNLSQVRLQYNVLTNIVALYSLPQLSYVDVRFNLLDISPGSLPQAVILGLQTRGVSVDYLPQRAAPVIQISGDWNISGDRTSVLSFDIFENGELALGLAGVDSHSSNLGLLPDSNQYIGLDTNSTSLEWALTVTPTVGQSGSTLITITTTNDVGLKSSTNLLVTVSPPLSLNGDFFGMTDLMWQLGGDVGWFGQTTISTAGFPAAQSGGITHGQNSLLESTLIGPGTLRYWWKVSSEVDYDWLIFESQQITNRISGEVDWREEVVSISPKIQTVRWLYTKDQNASGGMDAGWVARVTFVPATWLDLIGAPTNSHCHIALYGVPGQEYAVEISTNATDWSQLGTVLSTNRITPFVDTAATNAVRFYRARAIIESPILGLSDKNEGGFGLNWPGLGVLEASPTPNGPWQEVGGVSPFYVSTGMASAQFFRVKVAGE